MMYFIVFIIVFFLNILSNSACNLHFYKFQLDIFAIFIKKNYIVTNKNEFAVAVLIFLNMKKYIYTFRIVDIPNDVFHIHNDHRE